MSLVSTLFQTKPSVALRLDREFEWNRATLHALALILTSNHLAISLCFLDTPFQTRFFVPDDAAHLGSKKLLQTMYQIKNLARGEV